MPIYKYLHYFLMDYSYIKKYLETTIYYQNVKQYF